MSVKIALLGAGRIGQVHAKAIVASAGAELLSVTDASADAATAIADAFDCQIVSTDAAIDSEQTDAVLIATPTDTHADLIERSDLPGTGLQFEGQSLDTFGKIRPCWPPKRVDDDDPPTRLCRPDAAANRLLGLRIAQTGQPLGEQPHVHLQTLSAIARLFSQCEVRKKLKEASNAGELMRALGWCEAQAA